MIRFAAAALTGRFLQRKMHEFEQLKAEIESLQQENTRERPSSKHKQLSKLMNTARINSTLRTPIRKLNPL